MSQIKLTKNELRDQQYKLAQLERYLPTLQLKKAMLQVEVYNARLEVQERERELSDAQHSVDRFSPLLSRCLSIELDRGVEVVDLQKSYENIAGVEIPLLEGITFQQLDYSLFDQPPWVDGALIGLRARAEAHVRVEVAQEKQQALEHELREVSIRVNLFEKVLIPRTQANIKKIKVFLGDQQLAAVGQAKVAKAKIQARRKGS